MEVWQRQRTKLKRSEWRRTTVDGNRNAKGKKKRGVVKKSDETRNIMENATIGRRNARTEGRTTHAKEERTEMRTRKGRGRGSDREIANGGVEMAR